MMMVVVVVGLVVGLVVVVVAFTTLVVQYQGNTNRSYEITIHSSSDSSSFILSRKKYIRMSQLVFPSFGDQDEF